MHIKRRMLILLSGLLVVLAGVTAGIFWAKSASPPVQARQAAGSSAAAQGSGPLSSGPLSSRPLEAVPTPALAPGSTLLPQPTTFASVPWNKLPPCTNQPASSQSLAQSLAATAASGDGQIDYRRAVLLSPTLGRFKADEFNALLSSKDAEATIYAQRALISLAINLATGRLNRASEIRFPDLPEVKNVGDLLTRMEESFTQGSATPALLKAVQQVENGQGITQAVCAHLLTTQTGGQAEEMRWSASGFKAQALPMAFSGQQPSALDTVTVSPDGRWAAYTSLGSDSGGPIFLRNLASGAWTNPIDKINASLADGQAKLPGYGYWDVIGWMPDSQRLAIGAADASVLLIVEINSGQFKAVPFNGGGVGGEMALGLAPDGSQFAYVGESAAGDGQVLSLYQLSTGKVTPLVTLPYAQGTFYFPRFSPDGQSIAYMVQKGQPGKDLSYTINLYSIARGSVTMLLEGNLGLSLPAWSPDGRYLAFVRWEPGQPDLANSAQPLREPEQNVWVIDSATSKAQQLTFIHGQALKPKWAPDAQTISFITHDGQVGLVRVTAPGQVWRPGDAASTGQIFNSAAFVP